jgi:hypothetical protein
LQPIRPTKLTLRKNAQRADAVMRIISTFRNQGNQHIRTASGTGGNNLLYPGN